MKFVTACLHILSVHGALHRRHRDLIGQNRLGNNVMLKDFHTTNSGVSESLGYAGQGIHWLAQQLATNGARTEQKQLFFFLAQIGKSGVNRGRHFRPRLAAYLNHYRNNNH